MEILNYLPSNIVSAISWTLIHSVWQIAAVGLILFVFKNCTTSSNHKSRYFMAITALFSSLAISIFTFVYFYTGPSAATNTTLSNSDILIESDVTLIGSEISLLSKFEHLLISNQHLITLLWFVGMAFLMSRFLHGLYQTRSLKQNAKLISNPKQIALLDQLKVKMNVEKAVRFGESCKINTALVVGYWEPMILFPIAMLNSLTEEEVKGIIAHELAHIIRNDFIVNLFQTFAELLLYYHPVIWWIGSVINEEREICCDNLALKATKDSHAYANALVKLQEYQLEIGASCALAFSGKKNQFKNRILNILRQPLPKNLNKERSIALTAIMIFAFAFTNVAWEESTSYECETEVTETSDDDNCANICIPKDLLNTDLCLTKETDEYFVFTKKKSCVSTKKCTAVNEEGSDKKASCVPKISNELITEEIRLQYNITPNEITIMQLADDALEPSCSNTKAFDENRKKGLNRLTNNSLREFEKEDNMIEYRPKSEIAKLPLEPFAIDQIHDIPAFSFQNIDSVIVINTRLNEFEINNEKYIEKLLGKFSTKKSEIKILDKIDLASSNTSCNSLEVIISEELISDELINYGKEYKLKLTADYLKLNGKKQADSVWKKYKNIYEKRVGFPITKETTIVIKTTAYNSITNFRTI